MPIPPNYFGDDFVERKKDWKNRNICCIPECLRYDNATSIHRFPKDEVLSKLWKIKCRIVTNRTANLNVCSKHFLSNDFIKGKYDSTRPLLIKNAIPSQHLPVVSHVRRINILQNTSRSARLLRRQQVKVDHSFKPEDESHVEQLDNMSDVDVVTEKLEYLTIEQALILGVPIPKQVEDKGIQVNTLDDILPRMNVMDLLTSENNLNSWTGIPSFALLHTIEDCVCTGYPEEMSNGKGLSVLERILLCFIKLKTNLSFACMTSIFGIANSSVSRHFNSMLPLVKESLEDVVYFPSSEETKDNLPIAFRKYGFQQVRAIIDCSEVKIQALKCINCRICTFSRYKGCHTFKFMLSITPGGLISHVTKAFSGKASDKHIFNKENLILKFDAHNDAIMMDKGTLIEDELLQRNLQMVRPSFFRSELGQFEEIEQICNTKIASLRVHVERAIQRMKIFDILVHQMEYNVLPQVDNIIFICAAIANLTKPILGDDKF